MTEPCYSEIECKIIQQQIERRKKYRLEFLKQRTDPCKHCLEAGYVFDDALQRYLSMKACQLDHFQANPRTSLFGMCCVVVPMVGYGYLIWKQRSEREDLIRCGKIKYRDRPFKFA